jgi:hypothetical protein
MQRHEKKLANKQRSGGNAKRTFDSILECSTSQKGAPVKYNFLCFTHLVLGDLDIVCGLRLEKITGFDIAAAP